MSGANQIYATGLEVRIQRDGQRCVTTRNDVGGTIYVPFGVFEVRIVRAWYDHECGNRYAGVLTNSDQIAVVAFIAKTNEKPKALDLEPDTVYFDHDSIVEVITRFTKRELDCIRQAATGKGQMAIAAALNIDSTTVNVHLRRIYKKLGISGRGAGPRLTHLALQNGYGPKDEAHV